MSIVFMEDVYINKYTPYRQTVSYQYSEELEEAGNGSTIIVPANVAGVSIELEVSGGEGKVQATLTPFDDIIITEDNADWFDWIHGSVVVTTQGRCKPVTALRQVNVSGTTVLKLRAQ